MLTARNPARLLTGVAMAALCGGAAKAAEPAPTPPTAIATPVATGCQAGGCPQPGPARTEAQVEAIARQDVLGERGFYLESNLLIDDQENERVIARGDVEARYQGRVVRAQEVEYRTRTGLVIARGDARVLNADGTIQAADEVVLDENFAAGVATGFSTQLGQDIKLVAASAVRRSPQVTELNRAAYTPCTICTPEGAPKSPTFGLQAERITQDRNRRIIYYKNAVLKVKDVPVFYAPVFFHPDPTAERASGFLVPDIGLSDKRGVSYEQPYLYVISPSADLTITPQINSKVNPFLLLNYRQRFWSGEVAARFGYTYEEDFDSDGDKESDPDFDGRIAGRPFTPQGDQNRSFILADGRFELSETWRTGFTLERTSDDLIFDKYDIGDVYRERGLFFADDKRLLSQAYAVRADERSYLSVAALSFQGLRPGDDDSAFPTVAPLVEGRWEPAAAIAGGRLRVRGGGVALFRRGPVNPLIPEYARVEELDSSRATLEADWRRPITFSSGLRVEPLAQVRGDLYRVGDRPRNATAAVLALSGESNVHYGETVSRYNATVGAEVSYPLYRPTGSGSIILEPIAQVLISPDADRSDEVPNEDSVVLSFDETNLFDLNRFPGFDRYEGGRRMNVGGRATWAWGQGREASVFAGRSFRTEEDFGFAANSGLREKASDYVVAASITPFRGVFLSNRARLDGESGKVRRSETAVNVFTSRVSGALRHYYDDIDVRGVRTHELIAGGQYLFRRNWGVTVQATRDLEADVFRRRDIGVFYTDECVRLDVIYEREETFNRQIGPSDSISFRLTLATLGSTGSRDYD